MRIVRAFLVRDLRIARSYRAAFVGQVLGTLLFLASFAVVAPVVRSDFSSRFGSGYAAFAAVGIAITGVLLSALQAFSESVREAQLEGTLEAILMAPSRREGLVAAMGAYPVVAGLLGASLTLVIAAIFAGDFDVQPVSVVLAALASLGAFASLGLLAGAAMLIVKRGNPVATIVGMVGAVAGGAYAPVDTFPGWLARVADVNPVTYALDAWRGALLDARSPGDLAHPLVVLVAVAVVIGPIAWWCLGRALDVARADGTLGSY
jgi:ABC-2 type transport system permease protein